MRGTPRGFVLTAAALALFGGVALADEAAEVKNGEDLVESLGEFMPRLAKKRLFGFYYGRKSIGVMKWDVTKGDAPAVYQSTTSMQGVIRGTEISTDEWLDLDAQLGLIRRSQTGTSGQVLTIITTKQVQGTWVTEVSKDGAEPTISRVQAGPTNHWDSTMLLALSSDLTPKTYRLRGVQWPDMGNPNVEPKFVDLVIRVPPAAPYVHRGETVQAHIVKIFRGEKPAMVIVIDTNHEALAIWGESPGSQPYTLVAGTEDQVKLELPAGDEEQAVVAAVQTYYEVLGKAKPVEALDGVFDWKALLARPGVRKDTTPESFKQSLSEGPAAIDAKTLAALPTLLTVRVQGDQASARLKGSPPANDFLLERRKSGWKIVRVPGFGAK